MTPFITHTEHLRAIKPRDLRPQGIEQFRAIRLFQLLVALRFMDCHVEDAEMQLTESEQGIVDVLGLDEVLDQLIRDLLRRLRLPLSMLFPGV